MATLQDSRQGYRSLFWPIVLIGAGVTWLLINAGVLSGQNLAVLFRLWPLILIVVGVDLLVGRRSPLVGAIIGLSTVVLLVGLMLVGPSVGLSGPSLEIVTANYSVPLAESDSAEVNLSSGIGELTIGALNDSRNLLEAEIAHTGEMIFEDNEAAARVIELREQETADVFGANFLNGLVNSSSENADGTYWEVDLSPDVPLDLNISTGVGKSRINLTGLLLTAFDLNTGIGEVSLQLPASETHYPVSINSGVGSTRISIADGASVSLNISGGIGEVVLDVPDSAAVRVEGSSGIGNIDVPGHFQRVTDNDDDPIWETAGFNAADQRITVNFDGGIGNLTIQ